MTKKLDEENLNKLISNFYNDKAAMEDYKKIVDKENKAIKEIMSEYNLLSYDSPNFRATYTVRTKEGMNEELLLELLKKHKLTQCIKVVEQVDMEALERAIYNEELPKDVLKEMDTCRTSTSSVALSVKPLKK